MACIGSIPLGDICLSPRPLDFQVQGLRVSDVFQVGVLYISPAHPNSIRCISSGCCLVWQQFGTELVRLSPLHSPSSVWEILGLSRSSRATAFLATASTSYRGLLTDAAGTIQPIGTTRKPCASPPTRSTGRPTVATLWLWVPIPMQRTSAQACQRRCLTLFTSLWGHLQDKESQPAEEDLGQPVAQRVISGCSSAATANTRVVSRSSHCFKANRPAPA